MVVIVGGILYREDFLENCNFFQSGLIRVVVFGGRGLFKREILYKEDFLENCQSYAIHGDLS